MNENHKKSVATIAFWMLTVLFMSVIGSCLMSFSYKNKVIKLGEIGIQTQGVTVTDKQGDALNSLKFKEPKTGLKPATGELDEITKVPYTISAEVGSEGAYAKFCVSSKKAYSIYLVNIKVDKGDSAKKEIYAHLKEDKQHESIALDQEEVCLYTVDEPELNSEFILLIWLSQFANQELVGATITFDLKVVAN